MFSTSNFRLNAFSLFSISQGTPSRPSSVCLALAMRSPSCSSRLTAAKTMPCLSSASKRRFMLGKSARQGLFKLRQQIDQVIVVLGVKPEEIPAFHHGLSPDAGGLGRLDGLLHLRLGQKVLKEVLGLLFLGRDFRGSFIPVFDGGGRGGF